VKPPYAKLRKLCPVMPDHEMEWSINTKTGLPGAEMIAAGEARI
jgi:hypothetical protein